MLLVKQSNSPMCFLIRSRVLFYSVHQLSVVVTPSFVSPPTSKSNVTARICPLPELHSVALCHTSTYRWRAVRTPVCIHCRGSTASQVMKKNRDGGSVGTMNGGTWTATKQIPALQRPVSSIRNARNVRSAPSNAISDVVKYRLRRRATDRGSEDIAVIRHASHTFHSSANFFPQGGMRPLAGCPLTEPLSTDRPVARYRHASWFRTDDVDYADPSSPSAPPRCS